MYAYNKTYMILQASETNQEKEAGAQKMQKVKLILLIHIDSYKIINIYIKKPAFLLFLLHYGGMKL